MQFIISVPWKRYFWDTILPLRRIWFYLDISVTQSEIDAATFYNTYLDLLPLCKARGEVTVAPLESLVKRIWFPGTWSLSEGDLNTSKELVGETFAWDLAVFDFRERARFNGTPRTECHICPNKECSLWN